MYDRNMEQVLFEFIIRRLEAVPSKISVVKLQESLEKDPG